MSRKTIGKKPITKMEQNQHYKNKQIPETRSNKKWRSQSRQHSSLLKTGYLQGNF